MRQTLYFYDLETTGFYPAKSRIMQFAGQRTTLDLEPIGEPDNYFIKLSKDILPDPRAILITGITPQITHEKGLSEPEFLDKFHKTIAIPGTIFCGYNIVRFDDEFMRFLNFRNFWEPYEWQWKNGRGRFDMLDMVRMTRALRPEGIKWPFDETGKPNNRLENLAKINKLKHLNAHDALSDVLASIELAKLVRKNSPKLFDFIFEMRLKNKVTELVETGEPFVYTSGKYSDEFYKTTVVIKLMKHPDRQGVLVYDLRNDPTKFMRMNPDELAEAWRYKKDSDSPILPIKTLLYNRCPAVAPLSVLDDESKTRLNIDTNLIQKNKNLLDKEPNFVTRLADSIKILDKQQQSKLSGIQRNDDELLYDKFLSDFDRRLLPDYRKTSPTKLLVKAESFQDERLKRMSLLYVARNYYDVLDKRQKIKWKDYLTSKLTQEQNGAKQYLESINNIKKMHPSNKKVQKLMNDLKEWYRQVSSLD